VGTKFSALLCIGGFKGLGLSILSF
jgi:hypothetical protein